MRQFEQVVFKDTSGKRQTLRHVMPKSRFALSPICRSLDLLWVSEEQ